MHHTGIVNRIIDSFSVQSKPPTSSNTLVEPKPMLPSLAKSRKIEHDWDVKISPDKKANTKC